MGKQIPTSFSFHLPDGKEVTLETGKLATQADGSVLVRQGNTMMLATVCSSAEMKPGQGFFPLSVDYQEKFASVGRIPGNFFKRETKLSDYEVLISRLVDRAIRPLFPKEYLNETQVIITLLSADKETQPDVFVALAASAALSLSNIPFAGPIAEARVARINGEFVVNPPTSALKTADINIVVGATLKDVTMVEGEAKECLEADLIAAIKIGHEAIKTQCLAQLELVKLVGEKEKRATVEPPKNEELKALIYEVGKPLAYTVAKNFSDKSTRKAGFKEAGKAVEAAVIEKMGADFLPANKELIGEYFDKLKKETVRNMILDERVRLDGRKLDEVRPIWCEIDYLPATHGSSIFNRGETQALTSCTLGTKLDQAMYDTALDQHYEKFILHYNFPGYSVGEVKPQRAPGRREVGHANLAARSLRQVLPESPYTIRLVSDILESNGSSSMATVCAGSMALMDAGIPITAPVSGIAMGLIADGARTAVLSDILGDEDALGDMDFKITGTTKGITGCQMDIKVDGMPYALLEEALTQAREGRLHILGEMAKAISITRADLKPHAPRIAEIIVDKSFIGAIIGTGGSVIQELQAQTGTTINIDEVDGKGIVSIFGTNQESMEAALTRIQQIIFTPTEGETYEGKVSKIEAFGVFIDFKGKTGLMHVSEISHSRIENVEDVYKIGDDVKFMVLEYDKKTGKMRLSRKATIPREGGGGGNEGGGGGGGYERRGGGDDRRGGGGGGYERRGGGDDRRGGGGYGGRR